MYEFSFDAFTNEFTGTFSAVPPVVSAARLTAALLLGGIIGMEREWLRKPAGLRTHMLVSMAACLFIIVSQQLATVPFAFLAAGIIFTSRGEVHNITTGASMWLAGAIGLACGSGQIPLAVMATLIVLVVLLVLRLFEKWLGTNHPTPPE